MKKEDVLSYLKLHKRKMQEEYHVEKIGLFGSYAHDSEHFSSDIDLVLKFENDYINSCDPWDYFNTLTHIKNDVSSYFALHVDIVDEQSDSPYLSQIQKEAIYV
ncbi:nucleotidyltransferase family protein [Sulfurospirillum multivorans]|uniref:Nucleotidyltransferase domain-containing protein n=2 Tax=Sulfurospirillum multivorans TaxID=66821 RepID=A0AA86APR7_SULMK|nr:nucleotidyltransferase domain-containing protein [Sulfurospirillum multivorans]AHJ13376.1 nucleotidyltransferase domain-containing protein [Sulfurospirillum multivorans DSM 12446]NCB50155.1 hypothetical protein [Alphaproteobacteria bacterium]QEH06867.1 nucleotidyltransferase domain-containing protein [Sulfurospirillum multivorans]